MDNLNNRTETFDTAIHSLWFGLNYGSILTAFALYKTLEQMGRKPVLMPKPENMWTPHYAEKDNIAGLFIYDNCKVYNAEEKSAQEILDADETIQVVGSDLVWCRKLIGNFVDQFMLGGASDKQRKLSVGSSFGNSFGLNGDGLDNEGYHFLRRLDLLLVADEYNVNIVKEYFDLKAHEILDPVFLCDKQAFIDCAEKSAAKKNEKVKSFLFASILNGDKRKKECILRGNSIMLHNNGSLLRCMIDINRFPESKEALNITPAYFIRVEDYLYYLINSEFVFTDNVYAMYMAMVFEKPFIVLANIDDPDLYRFKSFLEPLGLSERIFILQEDIKEKEYLFRKPINYGKVNAILNNMRENDLRTLRTSFGCIEDTTDR